MAHRKLAFLGRLTLNALTIFSLLLCLAVLADWCTHPWQDNVCTYVLDCSEPGKRIELTISISTGHGEILIECYRGNVPASVPRSLGLDYFTMSVDDDYTPEPHRFHFLTDVDSVELGLPSWFLATLFAILPAIRLRSILRDRKRNRAGLCPKCGYDMRATPDRCPECGTSAHEN